MSGERRNRTRGWLLAGSLALLGIVAGGPLAEAAPARSGVTTGTTPKTGPATKGELTPDEKRHVEMIRRRGREEGLTKAQIHAEIEAYLRSIQKVKKVH